MLLAFSCKYHLTVVFRQYRPNNAISPAMQTMQSRRGLAWQNNSRRRQFPLRTKQRFRLKVSASYAAKYSPSTHLKAPFNRMNASVSYHRCGLFSIATLAHRRLPIRAAAWGKQGQRTRFWAQWLHQTAFVSYIFSICLLLFIAHIYRSLYKLLLNLSNLLSLDFFVNPHNLYCSIL